MRIDCFSLLLVFDKPFSVVQNGQGQMLILTGAIHIIF